VVYALNRGIPFVLTNREAQVSLDVLNLARAVSGEQVEQPSEDVRKPAPKKGIFAWR
jgi:hypothetical protein